MPDTKKIVDKAWNFAYVLRDDGLSYMAYTAQITFLLFLKMADEQSKPPYNKKIGVPEGLDWAKENRRLAPCRSLVSTAKNSNDTTARFSMNGLLRSGQEVRDARGV